MRFGFSTPFLSMRLPALPRRFSFATLLFLGLRQNLWVN